MSKQAIKKKVASGSRMWTEEEDEILKEIVESSEPQKWSYIVKVLEERYGISGRTPKQCEDRWVHDLEPALVRQDREEEEVDDKDKWTDADEKLMFKYHSQFGNKWAKIAQNLTGKTDNDVKNYFYCTLRRGFKKMNKYITMKKFKGAHKEIKMAVLSKCIAVAEDKFEKKIGVSEEIIEMCEVIKRKLVEVAKDSFKEVNNEAKVFQVANDLIVFNKSYRKKKKAKSGGKDKAKGKKGKKQQEEDESQEEEAKKQYLQPPGLNNKKTSKEEKGSDNATFDFLKTRMASGSMDFFSKVSSVGSADNTSKFNQVEYYQSEIKVTKVKKVTKVDKVQKVNKLPMNKKHSLDPPANPKLLTQSIEQLLQRNIKDYLLIPNLVVPSFQSNAQAASHLSTTSGEIGGRPNSDLLKFKEHFNIDNLLNASCQNMGPQSNNHLMTELKKISSIDFDLFCRQNEK